MVAPVPSLQPHALALAPPGGSLSGRSSVLGLVLFAIKRFVISSWLCLNIQRRLCSLLNMHELGLPGWGLHRPWLGLPHSRFPGGCFFGVPG